MSELRSMAAALGGDIMKGQKGDYVLCPGPGHSAKDRSLSAPQVTSAPPAGASDLTNAPGLAGATPLSPEAAREADRNPQSRSRVWKKTVRWGFCRACRMGRLAQGWLFGSGTAQ